jgi:Kdo2-lipid IVA lauroyltransferase/acyltransferase
MKKILTYIGLSLLWLVGLIPLFILYRISDFLFFLNFYILKVRKKVVLQNLRNSFPEKSEQEIRIICRKFFRHLMDIFLEAIYGPHMSVKETVRRCTVKDIEVIEKIYSYKKSIVLVSGHYGNWEWMSVFSMTFKRDLLVVYRPFKNKIFDRAMSRVRSRNGTTMISHNTSMKSILEYQHKNKQFAIWLLADVSPWKDMKFWTTFLNQDTSFYQGGERLAKKMDSAVVYMKMDKISRGHYELHFELLEDDPKKCKEDEILEKFVKKLESDIIKKPEIWLWSHRRWKYNKEEELAILKK